MKTKIFIVSPVLILVLFYCLFLNYNGATEVALALNPFNGKVTLQDKGQFYLTPPWVLVSNIDTRPIRVELGSASHAYSAKLVQFNPEGYEQLIELEGWHYYWWYNRLSFNYSYKHENRGFRDILRAYAYSPKKCQFVEVLEEY